ncbi:Uncharacterised protein [Mycobacteroides abscessus subsp. abscessus]|nr:Uncharacterised protein [Mycobacteroides abscessus subsp. abscessus]
MDRALPDCLRACSYRWMCLGGAHQTEEEPKEGALKWAAALINPILTRTRSSLDDLSAVLDRPAPGPAAVGQGS